MHHRYWTYPGSLLVILFSGAAQPAHGQSFKDLMEKALKNNPQIQQQEESRKVSEAQLGLTYSPLFPKLTAAYNEVKDKGVTNEDTFSVRADQMIFNGGTEYSQIAAKRRLYDAAVAQLDDSRDLVRYDLTQAMLNGSFARENLRIIDSSRQTQQSRLDELKRRFRLGQSREADMIEAEVVFEKLDRQVIDAQGSVDSARHDLSLAVREDFTKYEFPELDGLIAELRTSPLIIPRSSFETRTLELQIDAAREDEKTAFRGYLPSVSAYVSSAPLRDLRNTSLSGYAFEGGLQAQWTLFQGFTTPHDVEVASATRRKLEIQLADLQFTRQKDLAQLKIDRNNTMAKLKDLKAVVARAEKALKLNQLDYRRGLVTALETQTSIQDVLDLNLEQAQLRYKMGQFRAQTLKLGEQLQ